MKRKLLLRKETLDNKTK